MPAAPSPTRTLRLLTLLLRPQRANGSIDRTETLGGANNASTNGWRPTKGEGMTAGRLVHKRTMMVAALVAAIGAVVLAALLAQKAGPSSAGAADHLDAPGLTPPPGGDGIGTDLTDIYAFRSPADANKTVLIMNVNGLTTADLANPPGPDRAFGTKVPLVNGNPNVSYNFRIDSNGDAVPDVNIQLRFGAPRTDGSQQMRVKIVGPGEDEIEIEFEGRSTGFGQAAVVNSGRKASRPSPAGATIRFSSI